MAYFGILIAAVCVFMLISEYTSDRKKRAEEYTGICKLLTHIRGSVSGMGKPLSEIVNGFSCRELDGTDILHRLGRSDNLKNGASCPDKSALKSSCNSYAQGEKENFKNWRYSLNKTSISLDEADRSKLFDYFGSFGKNSIDEELKRLGDIISFFEKRQSDVVRETEKDVKVAWLLFAVGVVSIFILII